jgi:hypothetical protein
MKVLSKLCTCNNSYPISYFINNKCLLCNIYSDNKRVLLGLTGKIGSGKSTASSYLAVYKFYEYMFAAPLKDIAVTLGFEKHQVWGTQEQKQEINKNWGISGRKFLQVFGSEVCRDYLPKVLPDMNFNDKTIWCRMFEIECEKLMTCRNLVVSDVRFNDEADVIINRGGAIIKIERNNNNTDNNTNTGNNTDDSNADNSNADNSNADNSNANNSTSNKNYEYSSHKSENEKIKVNFVIRNNGTTAELFNKLENALILTLQGFHKISNAVIYI